ncbi:MAG TPA: PASTA domain-containing protein [Solirubrobacterales bacterium]|nr:PASTA domain-containing protein [Solirubrobacterales bacterium]
MSRPQIGDVIDGRYRIEALIGSGGMADVWLADDLHLPRRVALKILHDRFARDPEFIERFRREAESAAALQHVNIVSIFDRGEVGDTYYIAMAYIEGRTLRDLINLGLTPPESVAIVRQILEAAGFAHRHGVIHRDLKPLNVIVDATGLATVTDFGIARAIGVSDLTEAGSIMGTAHYLSPEQAQGMEVGPESDLYSVGVILYECLTGRVPHDGDSAVAVALSQMQESPPPPSYYNESVSPALDAVVMKALEREPIARFHSAEAFIEALDAAERDPGYDEPEEKSKKWIWLAAAAAVIALLIVFGLTRSNTVEVPNVVGESFDQAVSKLNAEGFDVGDVERIKQSGPSNRVLKQDPSGESDRDCKFLGWFCSDPDVNLGVSAGPGTVEVPDVTGQSRDAAEQTLDDAGFGVTVETKPSSDVPADSVIETDPAAGESAKRGSEVTMIVSSGPQQVAVPAVVGITLEAAKQRLSAKGLEYSSSETSSDRPAGEVLTQSPNAGTKVDPDSTVELTVSSGPTETTVSVPNVVGLTQSEAESAITGAGLTVSVQEQPTDIEPQDGRVIDQNPSGGGTVNEGTRIVIMVGAYDPDSSPPSGGLGAD